MPLRLYSKDVERVELARDGKSTFVRESGRYFYVVKEVSPRFFEELLRSWDCIILEELSERGRVKVCKILDAFREREEEVEEIRGGVRVKVRREIGEYLSGKTILKDERIVDVEIGSNDTLRNIIETLKVKEMEYLTRKELYDELTQAIRGFKNENDEVVYACPKCKEIMEYTYEPGSGRWRQYIKFKCPGCGYEARTGYNTGSYQSSFDDEIYFYEIYEDESVFRKVCKYETRKYRAVLEELENKRSVYKIEMRKVVEEVKEYLGRYIKRSKCEEDEGKTLEVYEDFTGTTEVLLYYDHIAYSVKSPLVAAIHKEIPSSHDWGVPYFLYHS